MTNALQSGVTVDAAGLETFTRSVLEAAGLEPTDAAAAADVLARTTLRGIESHGIWFLNRYVEQLHDGGANPHAQFSTVLDRGAHLVLDGGAGHGPAIAARATQLAIDRARQHGLAAVSVRNANHFGAAGHYALTCAESGCIGLALSNTPPIMAVTGSGRRSIGNNPLAFGAPRAEGPPMVLDIAMSKVAGGKVRMAVETGDAVPPGWILDPDGEPTTDPADFFVRRGALLPFADHKGYGLALMIETLVAVLSGSAMVSGVGNWLYAPDTPADVGYFLLAIDVGPEFAERMRALCDEIIAAPRAPGVDRIFVPGEPEHERETHARADGLTLRHEVWTALSELADGLGMRAELESIRIPTTEGVR
ncbi:MAG TPA: Ldh family oxidoreductase [Nocardioidaceae bacterium]|nr:Ldh family oxidoreductase [Nocardioidaceae bacterium]